MGIRKQSGNEPGRRGQVRFVFSDGLACPFFICAVCGEPLKKPGRQMIAWDMDKENSGEYELLPVYKALDGRTCLLDLERRIEDEDGGSMGTIELSDFIGQLIRNSGYEVPGGGMHFDGFGDLYRLRRRCRENSA